MLYKYFYLSLLLMILFNLSCSDDPTSADETKTLTDKDGNTYEIVKIGNQWWMAENLKVTHYRNGDAIPNVTDTTQWMNLSTGAYCNYDNDATNVATYGRLYNWYAATDGRNIAPAGWHVPTDAEWQTLVDYLGGSSVAGGKMKTTGTIEGGDGLWYNPNYSATNSSGFSARPGGFRHVYGVVFNFLGMGRNACFWSATENSSSRAWDNYLYYNLSDAHRSNDDKQDGSSVRLVRD